MINGVAVPFLLFFLKHAHETIEFVYEYDRVAKVRSVTPTGKALLTGGIDAIDSQRKYVFLG